MAAQTNATIHPTLSYRDAEAAIEFLERAFGFERSSVHAGEDGAVVHAELRLGEGVVMLGQSADVIETPDGFKAAAQSIYVALDDVDAHHERARAAGAEITRELQDTDYGSREYGTRDPEGHHWFFGTYRPDAG